MSNVWTIMWIVFFLLVISVLSFELGIAGVTPADELAASTDFGEVSGGLWAFVNYIIGMAKVFLKILSFQTSLPVMLNVFIMLPMSFGILFIVFTIIRGGAR